MKKAILFLSVVALAACNHAGHQMHSEATEGTATQTEDNSRFQKAVCILYPTEGSEVSGQVTFTQTNNGMSIVADVTGLTPGNHGFHIHEFGDCSAADGTSAGGHFNPGGDMHGSPMDMQHHEGDMGNITANEQGVAHLELIDKTMTFEGKSSIIGRGIIVHAGEDDLTSQPTGNSGARVACGTIAIAK